MHVFFHLSIVLILLSNVEQIGTIDDHAQNLHHTLNNTLVLNKPLFLLEFVSDFFVGAKNVLDQESLKNRTRKHWFNWYHYQELTDRTDRLFIIKSANHYYVLEVNRQSQIDSPNRLGGIRLAKAIHDWQQAGYPAAK